MSTRVDQLLAELKSGAISVTSEFRDEKKQTKSSQRIQRLKLEPKKQSKVLVLTELALPFDPRDGSETTFNNSNKFRPELSVENAVRLYQALAKEVPATKELLCRRSEVNPDDWVIDDPDEINEMSVKIFSKFRTPVVYSVNAFKCMMRNVTGKQYPTLYSVNINADPITGEILSYRDENGDVINHAPLVTDMSRLLNDLAYEEKRTKEEQIKNKEVNMTEKEFEEFKKQVNNRRFCITSIAPVNYSIGIELPLDDDGNVDKNLIEEEWDLKCLLSHMVYIKFNGEFLKGLDKIKLNRYKSLDTCLNFMAMDLLCGTDKDSLKLYQSSAYDAPRGEFKKEPLFAKLNDALNELYVPETHLEKIAISSTFMHKYTTDLENALIDGLAHPRYLDPKDPFLTRRVVERNDEILKTLFPEEIDDIYMRNDMQLHDGFLDEDESLKDGAEFAKDAVNDDNFEDDLESLDDLEGDVDLPLDI